MFSRPNVDPSQSEPALLAARTVFIVDDDEALVDALTELLRAEGHVVEPYTDGAYALARLREGARPHVILLDYRMPKMTGDDFLVQLDREGIHVPVMLFTAMCASRVRVPTSNVRAVIRKPFELKRLLEELANLESR